MAATGSSLRVDGYQDFMRACAKADSATKRAVRATFRDVGDPVKRDAAALFSDIDARSAAGYRTVVRQRGVAVEQKFRKTTGKHPEFGALQMRRALVPALEENEAETNRAFEHAIDHVCDRFER